MLNATHPVQVIHETRNRLARHRYVFELANSRLVLVRYHYETRRKIEEPWTLKRFYEDEPSSTYGGWEWVAVSDIPWTDDLEQEAKQAILTDVVVLRQQDLA